jgi:hypothetical protein
MGESKGPGAKSWRRATVGAASLVVGLLGVGTGFAGPAASFPEISFDAGEVRVGQEIVHVFPVRNTGNAALHITEVVPSCGCTIADYDRLVPAGGRGRITIRVKTAELPPGRLSKTISVGTDAPDVQRIVLQVKLTVVGALEFLPQNPVYIVADQGRGSIERLLLRLHQPGLKVTGVQSDNSAIEVVLAPADVNGPAGGEPASPLTPRSGDYWLTVAVRPEAPAGRQRAEVTVRTSDPSVVGNVLKVEAVVRSSSKGLSGG